MTGGLLKVFDDHKREVFGVDCSNDGKIAVSGSLDKTCILWDLQSLSKIDQVSVGARVDCVVMHPSSESFFAGDGKGLITHFKCSGGSPEKLNTFEGHEALVTSLAITSKGKKLVSGSKDMTAIVWNVRRGVQLLRLEGHSKWVQCVAVTPDNKKIITGSWDDTLRVWDVTDGSLLRTVNAGEAEGEEAEVRVCKERKMRSVCEKLVYNTVLTPLSLVAVPLWRDGHCYAPERE